MDTIQATKETNEYASRLREFINSTDLTKAKFASKLEMPAQHIYDALAGRRLITIEILVAIKKAYPNFDLEWFITGRNATVEKMRDLVVSRP